MLHSIGTLRFYWCLLQKAPGCKKPIGEAVGLEDAQCPMSLQFS